MGFCLSLNKEEDKRENNSEECEDSIDMEKMNKGQVMDNFNYPTMVTEFDEWTIDLNKSFSTKKKEEETIIWDMEDMKLTFNVGKGGMSNIWLCKNQKYAIKLIHKEQEVELTEWVKTKYNTLQHGNICRCYGYKEDETGARFLIEFLSGTNLTELIEQKHQFQDKFRYQMYYQMIQAVNFCHQQKLAHLDIKLDNFILVSQAEPLVKLIDFDHSQPFDNEPFTKQIGDFHYWSPEVINKNYNHQVDDWALGVAIYLFESQNFPFTGNSPNEMDQKIVPDMINIPKKLRPYIRDLFQFNSDHRLSLFQFLLAPIWFS